MGTDKPLAITVASYNVLADAYVRPEYYPNCRPDVFPARQRYPRLAERIAGLDADVVCLQEVDWAMFRILYERLASEGYRGYWAQKGCEKPDGCAVFARSALVVGEPEVLRYNDGHGKRGSSGHVAQIAEIACGDRHVAVVNTHLKWFAPDAATNDQLGLIQARELLAHLSVALPVIVCGDFNAETGSHVLAAFRAAGFEDAHDVTSATANPSGRAKKIDYLMHTGALTARPKKTPHVGNTTPLPSATEPSDHVPLVATFTLK